MSLDKAIESGKEHRKQYRKGDPKSFDKTCRNHGGDHTCEENRTYKNRKRLEAAKDQEKDLEE